jgi:hypothetical protein
VTEPCRLIGFPRCERDARRRCASQTRQQKFGAVIDVVDKTHQRLQGSGTEGGCVAHARLANKQIRCGLSRAFSVKTRSGPQAVRPSFAPRPVPVSQLVPDFDGWILMSCIRCCRDMAESGSRACDRHGRMTCMASALVCGASSTVRHSALFPSFQMHPYREREVGVDQKAACQKGPKKK